MRIESTFESSRSGSPDEGPEGYKPHIDGLRAIAILSVIGFHASIPGFGGGFVGVDVFFVISGYLIINQIIGQLKARCFSIWDFFVRRTLRILPPYFLMLAVVFPLGLLLLRSSRGLEDFVRSAEWAPAFLTNFYFLAHGAYFDVDAAERPLLHSWSLAVEEQFYILAPLVLLAIAWLVGRLKWGPNRLLLAVAAVVAIASFVGCVVYTLPWHNAAFYMTYWRAWEFVVGGALGLAGWLRFGRFTYLVGVGLGLIGVLLVGTSVYRFGAVFEFPGSAVAIPVVGAAMILLSGLVAPSAPVALVLSTFPFRFVGQISYALYLWHWPILVFGRVLAPTAPAWATPALLAVATGLAIATRYGVEKPIAAWRRHGGLGRRAPLRYGVVAATVLLAIIGAYGVGVIGDLAVKAAVRAEALDPMLVAVERATVRGSGACLDPDTAAGKACLDGSRSMGVIIGDSHAYLLVDRVGYEAEKDGAGLASLAASGCNPAYLLGGTTSGAVYTACLPSLTKFTNLIKAMQVEPEFAVFAGHWNVVFALGPPGETDPVPRFRRQIDALISPFAAGGKRRVLLLGPLPQFNGSDP